MLTTATRKKSLRRAYPYSIFSASHGSPFLHALLWFAEGSTHLGNIVRTPTMVMPATSLPQKLRIRTHTHKAKRTLPTKRILISRVLFHRCLPLELPVQLRRRIVLCKAHLPVLARPNGNIQKARFIQMSELLNWVRRPI